MSSALYDDDDGVHSEQQAIYVPSVVVEPSVLTTTLRYRKEYQNQQKQQTSVTPINNYSYSKKQNTTTNDLLVHSHNRNKQLQHTVKKQEFYRLVYDFVSLILILIGLLWFTTSFFLAKRSMVQRSDCNEGIDMLQNEFNLTNTEIQTLIQSRSISNSSQTIRNGCWLDRKVDSIIILVVDALRFDFAYYNLPNSIGKRLQQQQELNTNNDIMETSEELGENKTNANSSNNLKNHHHSRLFQFVADPPTVTMQRLKALTTGGLPTFADISSNFGGATVEEDTWINHLLRVQEQKQQQYLSRGLHQPTSAAFVGDDTWEDLFPKTFTVSYPYPSFNTRDLNTVDNGCLQHLPDLLKRLRHHSGGNNTTTNHTNKEMERENEFEVIVVHFLGVDHVGHTYGPHNKHMDEKLHQMDVALSKVLETVDNDPNSCHAVLIFGDHGMTPDGNHGGGTPEEINAALFVHTSTSGCSPLLDSAIFLEQSSSASGSTGSTSATNLQKNGLPSEWNVPNKEQFVAIHQIDLVPTISFLLGLPIPYANLGSFVPSIVPGLTNARDMCIALAMNAAQVWRYFNMYSTTANQLPNLHLIHDTLQLAIDSLKNAITIDTDKNNHNRNNINKNEDEEDMFTTEDKYLESSSLFKLFLAQALDLGQQVWTRFDTVGMISGIILLGLGLICYSYPILVIMTTLIYQIVVVLFVDTMMMVKRKNRKHTSTTISSNYFTSSKRYDQISLQLPPSQYFENIVASIVIIFQCAMLTFSNSYILEEDHTTMYGLAVLSLVIAIRIYKMEKSMGNHQPSNNDTIRLKTVDNNETLMNRSPLVSNLFCGIRCSFCALLLPGCSRFHELFVTGHGLDPSIVGSHYVHHPYVFILSSIILVIIRYYIYVWFVEQQTTTAIRSWFCWVQSVTDCTTLALVTMSWLEKRNIDPNRNGYLFCQVALLFLCLSAIIHLFGVLCQEEERRSLATTTTTTTKLYHNTPLLIFTLTIVMKIFIAIMIFTGPSTATSMVLYSIQLLALFKLITATIPICATSTRTSTQKETTNSVTDVTAFQSLSLQFYNSVEKNNHDNDTAAVTTTAQTPATQSSKNTTIESPSYYCYNNKMILSPLVIATLGKLLTRHVFFSTNHGCFFNRLQYSSAFVIQNEFHFVIGGIALSINTFGYEISSMFVVWLFGTIATTTTIWYLYDNNAATKSDNIVWRIYCTFQYLEAICSCISVSVLRRHLMVWDIYAPHFLFTMVFTVLNIMFHMVLLLILLFENRNNNNNNQTKVRLESK